MNPYLRPRPHTTTVSPPQHRNGVVRRNQCHDMNDASQSTVPNVIRHHPDRRLSRSSSSSRSSSRSSSDGVVQGPMMPTPLPPYQTAWQLLSHSTQPQSVEHEKNNDRVSFLLPPPPPPININTNDPNHHHPNPFWYPSMIPMGMHEISGAGGSGKTQLACSIVVQAAMTPAYRIPTTTTTTAAANTPDDVLTSTMETTDYMHSTIHTTTTTNDDDDDDDMIRAIYISMTPSNTHKVVQRITQMIQARCQEQPYNDNTDHNEIKSQQERIQSILRRIQIITCRTLDDFMEICSEPQGLLTQTIRMSASSTTSSSFVRIMVVDSIADLFRYNDHEHHRNSKSKAVTSKFTMERSLHFFTLTQRLQQLMTQQHSSLPLSILILNQVTSNMSEHEMDHHHVHDETPALGLSWSNCVHSRFQLQKRYHYVHHIPMNDIRTDSTSSRTTTNGTILPTAPINHNSNDGTTMVSSPPPSPQRVLQRTLTVTHSTRYPITRTNFIITRSGCQASVH